MRSHLTHDRIPNSQFSADCPLAGSILPEQGSRWAFLAFNETLGVRSLRQVLKSTQSAPPFPCYALQNGEKPDIRMYRHLTSRPPLENATQNYAPSSYHPQHPFGLPPRSLPTAVAIVLNPRSGIFQQTPKGSAKPPALPRSCAYIHPYRFCSPA